MIATDTDTATLDNRPLLKDSVLARRGGADLPGTASKCASMTPQFSKLGAIPRRPPDERRHRTRYRSADIEIELGSLAVARPSEGRGPHLPADGGPRRRAARA